MDRPAQFAGIYTDSEFNPIKKPEIFYCRIPNDYLPEPKAVLINGITPQFVIKKGFNEAEFAKRIYNILTIKRICIVGYNNIQFDDEVTRNIFYRNFYDPYSWSWKNSNSRWDILNVVRACYALRPDGINWPKNKDGYASFKLKHLTHANSIIHSNIHNAISDVYATIGVAKLVKNKQPKLFEFLFSNRIKEKIISMIDIIGMKPLVYVSNIFGSSRSNISLILPLAWHPNNNNNLIVVDLSKNLYPLIQSDIFTLQNSILEEIPLKLIHLNKCPVLVSINTLRHQDIIRLKLNIKLCFDNLELLRHNPEIRKKALILFNKSKSKLADFPNDNVDTKLYDGFFSISDRFKMKIIQQTNPCLLERLNLKFENIRLKELLFRYRARNFPDTLNLVEKKYWEIHRKNIFNEKKISSFLLEIKLLKQLYNNNPVKIKILKSLYLYAKQLLRVNK
ncbi:exodeoxyribonuclease I [Candidatus Pantoea edessiphila]|uniref:Exodeoxyribonuclease I n=1 Tax=Candidatus Pantoea edessiphila TaxID=2044610 RepID=A0A2P5SYP2_9GAMM|nr:exodeoxyribonuclease I [Pantoea sp. Edef]PPI87422.1 exodeoxyribonuclease I [Candidatus Pantoea edessiphila]